MIDITDLKHCPLCGKFLKYEISAASKYEIVDIVDIDATDCCHYQNRYSFWVNKKEDEFSNLYYFAAVFKTNIKITLSFNRQPFDVIEYWIEPPNGEEILLKSIQVHVSTLNKAKVEWSNLKNRMKEFAKEQIFS